MVRFGENLLRASYRIVFHQTSPKDKTIVVGKSDDDEPILFHVSDVIFDMSHIRQ